MNLDQPSPAPRRDTIGRSALHHASRRFVGRTAELAQLRNALSSDRSDACVVSVEGPPGVGKSTLAALAALHASAAGLETTWLPCAHIEPTLAGVLDGFGRLGKRGGLAAYGHGAAVELVVLDGFDCIAELASWLLTVELMKAGPRLVLMLTARAPLEPSVACHLALEPFLRHLVLEPFSEGLCKEFLAMHGARSLEPAACVAATGGLPLALATLVNHPDRWEELCDSPAARPALEPVSAEPRFGPREVRHAFKNLHRPARLVASPLLDLTSGGDAGAGDDAVARLVARLRAEVQRLSTVEKFDVYGEVLRATYVETRVKQHAAAIDLNLPWGTYRHRLRHAIEIVTEELLRSPP